MDPAAALSCEITLPLSLSLSGVCTRLLSPFFVSPSVLLSLFVMCLLSYLHGYLRHRECGATKECVQLLNQLGAQTHKHTPAFLRHTCLRTVYECSLVHVNLTVWSSWSCGLCNSDCVLLWPTECTFIVMSVCAEDFKGSAL